MSEEQFNVAVAEQSALASSAGDALRQAREATGLHIAALASLLKVPVKKLEALEGNRFDLLPDAVFVRALAASICRTLKVDAAPVLALLPMTASSRLSFPGVGINEQFRSPGQGPRPLALAHVSKPAIVAGAAFLLGTLALVFLPTIKEGFDELKSTVNRFSSGRTTTGEAAVRPVDAGLQSRTSGETTASSVMKDVSTPQALIGQGEVAGMPGSVNIAASVSAPMSDARGLISSSTFGTSSPTAAISAAASSATDIVVLTSTGDSWVEATDAKGKIILRRILAAGEVIGIAGSLPLKVIVGRANVTQVQIRGKSFDLNPVSKDNVARFEVK